jgi:uncharacterized protein (TIGR02246 family)
MNAFHPQRVATVLFVVFMALAAPSVSGQEASEEQAVRLMWQQFEELFHRGDSEGISQLYTADADRRDGQAEHARGRAAVRQMYEDMILARPSRQNTEATRVRFECQVRFLRPDVALLDGFYIQPSGIRGMFTVVATKEQGAWRMAAGRAGAILD